MSKNPPCPPLEKGGYSKESQFDKQGAYFWSLVKQAGWTRAKAEMLMLKNYRKTHWNILDSKEKRQIIATMKNYAKKGNAEKAKALETSEKRFRQRIMALWSKTGHTKDELYDMMVQWGYQPSLRACRFQELCSVWEQVRVICGA